MADEHNIPSSSAASSRAVVLLVRSAFAAAPFTEISKLTELVASVSLDKALISDSDANATG